MIIRFFDSSYHENDSDSTVTTVWFLYVIIFWWYKYDIKYQIIVFVYIKLEKTIILFLTTLSLNFRILLNMLNLNQTVMWFCILNVFDAWYILIVLTLNCSVLIHGTLFSLVCMLTSAFRRRAYRDGNKKQTRSTKM